MIFDYFYGKEAEQFSFIRVPKLLIKDKAFSSVSFGAKLLYGILLDRMSLSIKNRWLDEEDRVFIIFRLSEIEDELDVTEKMAIKFMRELEQVGLIEKKRRGLGLPSLLYVKSFIDNDSSFRTVEIGSSEMENLDEHGRNMVEEAENEPNNEDFEHEDSRISKIKEFRPPQIDSSGPSQIDSSRTDKMTVQDLPDLAALKSNTEMNNTKESNTESDYSHLIISDSELMDEMDGEETLLDKVKEQIGYESLCVAHQHDIGFLDGVVDMIAEILLSSSTDIVIASNTLPMHVVKERFMRLTYWHIEYVLQSLQENTGKIKNIKKYLLTMLFNAPATMDGYYQAEVNHDMARMAI